MQINSNHNPSFISPGANLPFSHEANNDIIKNEVSNNEMRNVIDVMISI